MALLCLSDLVWFYQGKGILWKWALLKLFRVNCNQERHPLAINHFHVDLREISMSGAAATVRAHVRNSWKVFACRLEQDSRPRVTFYFLPILIVWSQSSYLCWVLEARVPAHAAVWCWAFYAYSYFTVKTGALPVLVSQKYFYVPKFAPGPLLLVLSCLKSVESEIATGTMNRKGLMQWKACLITERKASLTRILHHWVFCLALRRHYINMTYFITSKIGITARHSRFILLGKNCGG